MPIFDVYNHALNQGIIDKKFLHRTDLLKMRLSAEVQRNLLPSSVGPATFRPGFEHLESTKGNNRMYPIPFEAGDDAAYLLELTDGFLRVWDPATDLPITRPTVSSTITSGDFSASTGWTLNTAAGQTSAISGGLLALSARGNGATAFARQQVATATPGILHAVRIHVARGPVVFRIGSTSGDDDYVAETALQAGFHSLAFIPNAAYWIQFSSSLNPTKYVYDIAVEAAGIMELTTPWAIEQLPLVRFSQSIDTMYLACEGVPRQMIERRGQGGALGLSWSIVNYEPDDGQFLIGRTADVTMTPSVLNGIGTLTASAPFFKPDHFGALFSCYHDGQSIDEYLAGPKEHTTTWVVTGVKGADYNDREWTLIVSGTWVGTLRVERSFDGEDFEFHEYRRATGAATIDITSNATFTNDDEEDNAIVWYRVTFSAYTSGEARIRVTYNGGGGVGICRLVSSSYSSTVAGMEVLRPFKGTTATKEWQEGEWSTVRGQPGAVEFRDGRLAWFGPDRIAASVSDAYLSFDQDFTGEAGPLVRALAIGGSNIPRWALSMSSLVVGCDGRIAQVRASALDEYMTPDNFGVKNVAKIGVARVAPILVSDDRAIFVHESTKALYELSDSGGKLIPTQFSKLTTDVFTGGILGMALQQQPDQRIWIPVEDSDCVLCIFVPEHEVMAFVTIAMADTDILESVCVLPRGDAPDRLYASIRRTVDGATVRYVEKLALDSEALPATITKCLDSFVTFGAGAQLITTLTHLIGRTVRAWMDGAPVLNDDGTIWEGVVTAGGEATLPRRSDVGGCIGLAYDWQYKSARLEYGAEGASTMKRKKSIKGAGALLSDYVRSGVKIGTNFTPLSTPGGRLQSLPEISSHTGRAADEVVPGVPPDEDMVSLPGEISYDTRFCMAGVSPYPATIRSIVISVDTKG